MKTRITGGMWLFITCSVYALAGLFNHFVYKFTEDEYIQLAWVLVMWLPLIVPMQRWINVPTYWEILKNAK